MTPINTMLSMIELLRQASTFNSYQAKYLETCFYSVHQMIRCIKEAQSYQRLQDGQLVPQIALFDITEVLQEI